MSMGIYFDISLRDDTIYCRQFQERGRERSNYNLLIFVVFNERLYIFLSNFSSALSSCLFLSLNGAPGNVLQLFSVFTVTITGWR